ncbi:MAG: zinc ABC transporter substrate-binding protein [Planctomycetota bacterium]|nr:zinc ABC transporter substrate-binding protein [Planctomycetota bacterium]
MKAVLICLLALFACTLSAVDRPLVVCSTTQIADFARQVGGDRIQVACILKPGADPHTYQSTTADARLVLDADLCLENGLHLEGNNWMAKLAKDAGKPVVTCTEGVALLRIASNGETVADPHAWMDPRNAATYVRTIQQALTKLMPAHGDEFAARTTLFLQQLRALDAWVREQIAVIPVERRVLVTSHDAFNYFCRTYGFEAAAPVGWSTAELGAGIPPERRQAVVESIRSQGVKAVFVETSVSSEILTEIANEAGIRIGGSLYSDSMGAPGSAGADYIGMMRENVLTIAAALR